MSQNGLYQVGKAQLIILCEVVSSKIFLFFFPSEVNLRAGF